MRQVKSVLFDTSDIWKRAHFFSLSLSLFFCESANMSWPVDYLKQRSSLLPVKRNSPLSMSNRCVFECERQVAWGRFLPWIGTSLVRAEAKHLGVEEKEETLRSERRVASTVGSRNSGFLRAAGKKSIFSGDETEEEEEEERGARGRCWHERRRGRERERGVKKCQQRVDVCVYKCTYLWTCINALWRW